MTQKQIKAVLDSNKFKYNVGHASFVLQCPFCGERRSESGRRTMFVNKTTGALWVQALRRQRWREQG